MHRLTVQLNRALTAQQLELLQLRWPSARQTINYYTDQIYYTEQILLVNSEWTEQERWLWCIENSELVIA